MQLTYLGHSTVALELANQQVLIDPFISGNPVATANVDDFSPSHIIVTHAHGDHYGDTESIATRSGATLVSTFEIVNYAANNGVSGHGMNIGGGFDFDFGRVTFTPAWCSSQTKHTVCNRQQTGMLSDMLIRDMPR